MVTKRSGWMVSGLGVALIALTGCAVAQLPDGDDESSDAEESPKTKLPKASGATDEGKTANTPNTPSAPGETPPPSNPLPGTKCDLANPFKAPVLVLGLPAGQHLATPRLSSDERTIFFTTKSGTQARIASAVRATGSTSFGPVTILDAQSSAAKDNDPSVSADGAMLFFSSERGGSNDKLYMALATAPGSAFGAPQLVSGVGSSNAEEQHPYYRVAGGGELWFSSNRGGQWEIWTAKKSGTGFSEPARVEELRDPAATRQPMVSEDGLTIVFASERKGGLGGRDLWLARRASTASPFGAPEVLTNVNSPATEFGGWLSPDGCRLYFSSDRETPNLHRIYVATRP